MWRSLVWIAAGCGRVAFDPSAGDGSITPDDGAIIDAAPLGPFGPAMTIPVVDSTMAEDDGSMTGDMLEIYFLRGNDASSGTIMMATRASTADGWGTPIAVPVGVAGEATARVSRDGLRLYIGSQRGGGAGGVDIWLATRTDRASAWNMIANVVSINSGSFEFAAMEYAAQTRLIMTTDRTGNNDLFETSRATTTGPWDPPQSIGVNVASTDQDPFMSDDGLELWFMSTRGGNPDFYRATRASLTDPFGPPAPVTELNTSSEESDPWLSPDRRTIMFASNRSGNHELYIATR